MTTSDKRSNKSTDILWLCWTLLIFKLMLDSVYRSSSLKISNERRVTPIEVTQNYTTCLLDEPMKLQKTSPRLGLERYTYFRCRQPVALEPLQWLPVQCYAWTIIFLMNNELNESVFICWTWTWVTFTPEKLTSLTHIFWNHHRIRPPCEIPGAIDNVCVGAPRQRTQTPEACVVQFSSAWTELWTH